jgi:3-hydroxy-9,10-secoandrosta-1,3,5(10)-triene-9,17-dione monooxygenase
MLDAYIELLRARVSRASGNKAKENGRAQHVAAETAAVIDGCRLVIERNFGEMMADVEAGRAIDLERRIKYRYDSSRAVESCLRMVDQMFTSAGGAPVFLSSPLNRYFQDAHAARAHYANNPVPPGENMGRVAFGLKNTDFFL